MDPRDGLNHSPTGAYRSVVQPGEFPIAAAFLDHGHINAMVAGLVGAGATLRAVYDRDPSRLAEFLASHPGATAAPTFESLLDDSSIRLVASAAIPSERSRIGSQVLRAGKHYFSDKAPFTSLDQLRETERVVAETGRTYAVYYGERLHNHATHFAAELVRGGAIGRVVQMLIIAPHNLNRATRPPWFFQKEKYGGIITDIGSHQFEQFLYFAGATDGEVNFARVDSVVAPDLEDFGEASLTLDTGASAYCRLDWLTPAASRTWGDGRAFVLGTEGYVEVRQNVNVGYADKPPAVYLVNGEEERVFEPTGNEEFPFFGRLIRDCLDGTETAMTQAHAFAAARLSLQAQALADQRRMAQQAAATAT
jgi:predicted dehydrogenase